MALGEAITTVSGSTLNPKPQGDQASATGGFGFWGRATRLLPENHRRTIVLRLLSDGSPMVLRWFSDGSPTVLRFSDGSQWFSDGSPTVLLAKE